VRECHMSVCDINLCIVIICVIVWFTSVESLVTCDCVFSALIKPLHVAF